MYNVVLNLLCEYEKCRNSDQYLIAKVWQYFHQDKFMCIELDYKSPYVSIHDIISTFESPETITRVRRDIQNNLGLFQPTLLEVVKQRKIKEEQWRENMSYQFTKEQANAILEIYLLAREKSSVDIKKIKEDILSKI